ncbi:MAG: dephospho-CoA kinase [Gammaproteobacteria bacterium]|jgi:dephospho-CoA kinase|nr:dephospho-CoA kinase [Gammaproteobacteria bacterium]
MAPFVVGLTGGIGSGKTAVSDRFQSLGIHVVDGDQASRAVLSPGQPALAAVVEHFGDELIQADGTLDRAALRRRVFADEGERRWLEKLTHPLMAAWLAAQIEAAASPYCLLVNPLLVESGQAARCHRVLVVDAPESAQLERTMARDGESESQVRAIMAAQADRQRRLAAADDVIVNDRDLEHLDAAVARLHEQYLELARR